MMILEKIIGAFIAGIVYTFSFAGILICSPFVAIAMFLEDMNPEQEIEEYGSFKDVFNESK